VATVLPPGPKATASTSPLCPRSRRRSRPLAASHRQAVPSRPAVATTLPPGANARDVTAPPWRQRAVPIRARAPAGSGSPVRSRRGFAGVGSAAPAGPPSTGRRPRSRYADGKRSSMAAPPLRWAFGRKDEERGRRLTGGPCLRFGLGSAPPPQADAFDGGGAHRQPGPADAVAAQHVGE